MWKNTMFFLSVFDIANQVISHELQPHRLVSHGVLKPYIDFGKSKSRMVNQ